MKLNNRFSHQLYLVISEADCKKHDFLYVAEQSILGGVDVIQLREKDTASSIFLEKALRLKEITEKYQVPLIINDNLEVAIKVDADGIHVGNNDLPPTQIRGTWSAENKMIGYSIESLEQLSNKEADMSDYLGISPVFKTPTKEDTIIEWGLRGVSTIRALTTKPLVAIGNIQQNNAQAIIQAGADCIAVVSAICSAPDPRKAAVELKKLF